MKRKIYAIFLLLSFLVVLSHELIAHHHHEDVAFDFSSKYVHDNEYNQLQDKESHNHKSNDEDKNSEHNHTFPLHHHISATNDFDIERTNLLESNSQIPNTTSFIIAYLFIVEFPIPPNLERNLYREHKFLISSLFNPAANALRGPPFIV